MSRSPEKTWILRVVAPRHVLGIRVGFAQSQTEITGARLLVHGTPRDLRSGPFVVWQKWSTALPTDPGSLFQLSVSFRGEPPRISSVTWAVGPGDLQGPPDVVVPSWVGPPPTEDRCAQLWQHELIPLVVLTDAMAVPEFDASLPLRVTPARLFEWRRQAIDDRAAASAFFLQLDIATTPGIIDTGLATAIAEVGYSLWSRLQDRRFTAQNDEVPRFAPIENDDLFDEHKHLTAVSALMRSLIEEHLVDPARPDLFDWTFESFATDLLAVAHQDPMAHAALQTHGAPNGVGYFKFAELALFCIENSIDAAFWRKRLATFVRTAHVFAENAPEHTVPPSAASPYPIPEERYAYAPGRFYPRRRLEELRARYAAKLAGLTSGETRLFLEDRLTWIVGHALPATVGSSYIKSRSLDADAELDALYIGGIDPAWSIL